MPEVLIEGNHAKIQLWRRKQQLKRTREKRPDMFKKFKPQDKTDKKLLKEVEKDANRMQLTKELSWRMAVNEDVPRIMEIVADAKASLAKFNVDQWQGPYPTAERFEEDIRLDQCYVVCHGEEVAGVLVLSLWKSPAMTVLPTASGPRVWSIPLSIAPPLVRLIAALPWQHT